MVRRTNARQCLRNCAVAALLVVIVAPLGYGATKEAPRVDLAALPSGSGAVFGSVQLRWEAAASAGGYEVGDQRVSVFPESLPSRERLRGPATATLRARLMSDEMFLLVLPVGQYDVCYMQPAAKGPRGWRPRSDIPLMSIGAHFNVREGKVQYIGRLAIEMPVQPRGYTLSAGLMHVDAGGFAVENARDSAVEALLPQYGEPLAAADTELARAPDDLQTGEFEQLAVDDQKRIGARFWDMLLPAGVAATAHSELKEPRQHMTRLVFTGDHVDWEHATEGLEIVLWETDHFSYTPRTFFEEMRASQSAPGSTWNVLDSDDRMILYEVVVPIAESTVAYELFRIVIGERHALSVMYARIGTIPDETRRAWTEALGTARTKND